MSCYDAKTGELKWKHNDIKTIITCGDIIGLCSINNKVIVYDGISFSEIMDKPDGEIIAAGSDLLLKNNKSVECIDGHTKKIKWTSNNINEVLGTSEYLGQFRQDMYIFCRFDEENLILTLIDSKNGTIKKESSFLLSVEGDMYIDADVVLDNDGRILVPLQSEYGSYVYTYDFDKNSFIEVSDNEIQSVIAVVNTVSKYDTLNMKYMNDYVLVLVNNNRPEIIWLVFGSGDIDHPESLYSSHFGSERKSQFQDG